MAITKITPALSFSGTASKAIALYERSLGARVETITRFSEAPTGTPVPADYKDRVMHALLRIGDQTVMAMDAPPSVNVPSNSNVQVTLEFDDPADLVARFDALAAGGNVRVAPQESFFAAKFGMLTDAFGIMWILLAPRKG
jgi:PhnB protein